MGIGSGKNRRGAAVVAVAALVAVAAGGPPALAGTRTTTLVSAGAGGTAGNGPSERPSISGDGRLVAFVSRASNLVAGDTNGVSDVFVADRAGGSPVRVSVSSSGVQGNADSVDARISANGRYVLYSSDADNLVPGDTNGRADIFRYDLLTRRTSRVSNATGGGQSNGDSLQPWSSADGSVVAYLSFATNLASGDTNGINDVFVSYPAQNRTIRVNVATDGTQADGTLSFVPSLSGNGKVVAFISDADNLVPGDTNGVADAFARNLVTGTTFRLSVASDGTQANDLSVGPSLDYAGRNAVFVSHATNLVPGDTNGAASDVFVRDIEAGTTSLGSATPDGSRPDAASFWPSLSANARYLVFVSYATNLVPGNTAGIYQVYLRDRRTGEVSVVSVARDGTFAGGPSFASTISADGSTVAFTSGAGNLVRTDPNGAWDVFARKVSVPAAAPTGSSPTETVSMERDRFFSSSATDGDLTVTAASAVKVPFFQYGAIFTGNTSSATWQGAAPAAGSVSLTDNWHVDYIGVVAPGGAPADAVVTGPGDIRWTTGDAAHSHPAVSFFALSNNSIVYRIKYQVSATVTVDGVAHTVTTVRSARV